MSDVTTFHDAAVANGPRQLTTAKVFSETITAMPGVTTTPSNDKDITLNIRRTVLCDLFPILIADSVYGAHSRVLIEIVAQKLGLGWLDVVKFECHVTKALEIQEGVETLKHKDLVAEHQRLQRRKRYMMLGLATLGGGLLFAGLLAPVIGTGLGAVCTTIGIGGTTGFLAGTGGAAVITPGGVLTGSGIAVKGMSKRLVLDPVVRDAFSVLCEPKMIQEPGSALSILTGEVLSQVSTTVLQATVMTALMSASQWPVILTKLGYLIDNPWNNALDRAKLARLVLADVVIHRHFGVRPVTLIGFSLGARALFYALLEIAKQKAFGIVQDVFLLDTTLSASTRS
ncbi:hypothetical protein F5887DRAFT_1072855 [Amanita rubescens]|nr:hypothetical protein F5887DRAFT_1072855 [Amanita rubescens]